MFKIQSRLTSNIVVRASADNTNFYITIEDSISTEAGEIGWIAGGIDKVVGKASSLLNITVSSYCKVNQITTSFVTRRKSIAQSG
jgi:hypothetical protein